MITAPSHRHDRRRRIDAKAKAAPLGRCWGLDGHLGTRATRRAASPLATAHDGAPGLEGVTFEAIAASGGEACRQQLRDDLVTGPYRPRRNRRQAIPKAGGQQVRGRSIPALRDRVVQGALQRILAPIVEADVHAGS
jgi:RNA-directed DNA polymerase